MRYILFILTLIISFSTVGQNGQLKEETIAVDGLEREYLVYLPKGYTREARLPLVLAFHGGGGTAKGAATLYNFNPLADRENFIVVYPNGIEKSWNDGRIAPKKPATTDDVKFISMLIDKLIGDYGTDPARVFSTGLSNGAIFSIYLAYKIPDKILAIAPVCGSMPVDIEKEFKLSRPVAALFINGTADKLVKYNGGPVVSERAGRGSVIGVDKLRSYWIRFNQCTGAAHDQNIDDTDTSDGCSATLSTYTACGAETELVFIKITGGGHTWAGGKQYLPRFIVGNVCRDFKAEEVIWDFFKRAIGNPQGHTY